MNPQTRMLVVPVLIGAAIALAVTFSGPLATAGERAPIALLGGASFAAGGGLMWAYRRWVR